MKNIKSIQINFRPSSSVRPNLTSTRAGDKIEFLDLEAPKKKKGDGSGEDNKPGGGGNEGGGGDEEAHEPYNRHEKDQSDRDSLFRHP